MPVKKILLALAILSAVAIFYSLGLNQYLSLENFLSQRDALLEYQAANPWKSAIAFFTVYVAITAFSLPAAALITLAGGAIFGLGQGVVLVSFASTIGASFAFLMARTLFRDSVQERFKSSF